MENKHPFDAIKVPELSTKPREHGITMVIDWGEGLSKQQDVIDAAGDHIDIAKIAVGISRMLQPDYLKRKISLYQENGIRPFPGGQFLELAVLQNKVTEYLEAAKSVGYDMVEVSDNAIDITAKQKREIIQEARAMGFTVLGEVGKKVSTTDANALIADIQNTLDSGSWKVFVEAQELFGEQLNTELIEQVVANVDPSQLIFEIPGPYLPDVHHHQMIGMWKWLLNTFGIHINIANIPLDDAVKLAVFRMGIGPDTSFKDGAFIQSEKGLLK